jgi:hypothetical protein
MTTKQRIHAEIDKVGEESLDELYDVVRKFVVKASPPKGGIMSKLKGIAIDAPADFAANLDLYLSGEKRAGQDLH